MGTLEFSVKGLAEELRRRRDAKRGPALLTILLIASLLVLTNSRSPDRSGIGPVPEQPRGESVPVPVPDSDNGADPQPQAAAQISPGQRNFGSRAVGDSSDYYSFTLTNVGALRVAPKITLNSANANAFSFKEQCVTLEPKQRCTIEVAFVPRAAGKYSGRLVVHDEGGHPLATANLSGAGEPQSAAFTANPMSISFPPQQIGTNSATQTLVLRNTRARQFFAGYDTASGTGTHFGILNCRFVRYDKKGTSGDSCTINVSFHPTMIGPHTEVLELREMSAPGVPINNVTLARITLEGSGTSAALRISPRVLNFSDPNGSPQSVLIENVGTVAITINGAPITGSNSNRFTANVNACRAQPIAPNSRCVITVAHRASPQQTDNAELEVSHTAASAPDKVQLTWKAPQMPQFSVSPTSLDIGVAPIGERARLQMTLTNVGAAPANSVVMGFMLGDRSSFAIADDSCSGRTLAPQGQCTAILVFEPKKSGSLSTNLVVSDSGLKGMTTFSVTGQATAPAQPIG